MTEKETAEMDTEVETLGKIILKLRNVQREIKKLIPSQYTRLDEQRFLDDIEGAVEIAEDKLRRIESEEYWWRIVQYQAQGIDQARTLKEARKKKEKWQKQFPSSTVEIWDAEGNRIE